MTVQTNGYANGTEPRGWVEIYEQEKTAQAGATAFDVYDWSEHHDSAAVVHTCNCHREAVSFAKAYASANNRRMPTAELVDFPGRTP